MSCESEGPQAYDTAHVGIALTTERACSSLLLFWAQAQTSLAGATRPCTLGTNSVNELHIFKAHQPNSNP